MRRLSVVIAAALVVPAVASGPVLGGAPTARADELASCTIVPSSAADAQPVNGAPEDVGDGGDIAGFVEAIVANSAADGLTDGAGWLLSLMLGNVTGNASQSQILANQAAQQTQLNGIQSSINNLANQLTNAEYEIQSELVSLSYDSLVGGQDGNIAAIQASVQAVCDLAVEASTYNVTNPYLPDSTDINTITNLRDNGIQYLDQLSDSLLGVDGAGGIIDVYRQAYWANHGAGGSNPPSTATWTADYLQSMHSLLDYYTGLAVQLFNAYAEAVHWSNAASVGVDALAPDNPQQISDFYQQLQPDLLAWSQAAVNDLPTIPEGTAVDIRTGSNGSGDVDGTYDLWAIAPVTLEGTISSQYCTAVVALCLYNLWDASATPSTVSSSTVVPSVLPAADFLVTDPLGESGWAIPTMTDWADWITPTYLAGSTTLSGLNPDVVGVATWAAAESIPILTATAVPVPGTGGTSETVAPVIVDDPTYQVLTFNGPTATPATPLPAAGSGVGYAGQLALLSSVTAAPPPFPTPSPSGANVDSAGADATAHASAAVRGLVAGGVAAAPDPEAAATSRSASATTTASPLATVGQSTIFSSGASCTANTYTQPSGANAVTVTVIGGSGGGGTSTTGSVEATGGLGGQVTATLPLGAGATIYAQVGGNGTNSGDGTLNQPWNPGSGGSGGGADGGTVTQLYEQVPVGAGGGGGGFSGITADSGCEQWLVVAGGGGGAGGIDEHNTGSNGGNACVSSGCAGQTPSQVGSDTGYGTGGTLLTPGGGGEHYGKSAGSGTAGTRMAGGIGGVGGNDSTDPLHQWQGSGGGGGGGGWNGGGGGGGSTGGYAGGGGGGGGSYVASGISTAGFSTTGDDPVVVITPVVAPEYIVAAPGGTWDGQSSAPTIVIDTDKPTSWGLLSSMNPVAAGPFSIAQAGTTLCTDAGSGAPVLAECSNGASQQWNVAVQGFGGYLFSGSGGGIAIDSSGALTSTAETPFPFGLNPAPDSMWSLSETSPLQDVGAEPTEPGAPGTTPGSPGDPSVAGAAPDRLAATGLAPSPAVPGLALLLLVAGSVMVAVVALRARRRRRG